MVIKIKYLQLSKKLLYFLLHFPIADSGGRAIKSVSLQPFVCGIVSLNLTGAELWMSVCSECCMSSGRSSCDWPILRTEESYRLRRV
jgi:hypothetical protein